MFEIQQKHKKLYFYFLKFVKLFVLNSKKKKGYKLYSIIFDF